ncbi:unnamed protein product [Effrenium voratum]|uniref:FCP1 homology domain-containing protein n=1 Tax=Effrenium voratum TaxID=2562239 RepID=A0AA36J2V2_9DINO|nr:unnamed protein product [Effrenium voratum]CAJ1427571.1 unnamed protein product [Effrenium voratum]
MPMDMSLIPSKLEDASLAERLRRRILVDNNPVSCVLHPTGSVLVRDWLGEGAEDQELLRVQKILEAVLQADTEGDYAACLARATGGFNSWSARLQALGERLDGAPPTEADELRRIFREVSRECNDMKRELLGAAP